MSLAGLSHLRAAQDRLGEAQELAAQALRRYEALGDPGGAAAVRAHLGYVCRERGALPAAVGHLDAALRHFATAGDPVAVAYIRRLLGACHLETGDLHAAAAHLEAARATYTRLGNRHGVATTLRSLGLLRRAEGDLDGSARLLEHARDIFQERGDELLTAYAVRALAKTWIRQGRVADATAALGPVYDTCRRLRDRWGDTMTLRVQGEAALARAELSAAEELLTGSVARWEEIGAEVSLARSLYTLSLVQRARGDGPAADRSRTRAVRLFAAGSAREHRELTGGACPSRGPETRR
ncbi:MAG TPA: tetratricopeptide repeat protein [Pilimelia sp.]|nr:tetratricopeptide repeat protein [Pilimelia sp.]